MSYQFYIILFSFPILSFFSFQISQLHGNGLSFFHSFKNKIQDENKKSCGKLWGREATRKWYYRTTRGSVPVGTTLPTTTFSIALHLDRILLELQNHLFAVSYLKCYLYYKSTRILQLTYQVLF